MDRYEVIRPVGQGAYGIVLRARTKESGRTVAIKKMAVTSRNQLQILRELCTLRNLHHPKILKLIDVFCSQDTLSLVTEFVPFTLSDVIADPRRPKDDLFFRFFFKQIIEALKHMHSLDIMHRDLKPENILVTPHNIVKIADFGQSCLYYPNDSDREYEENVATRQYRAPELLFGCRKYSPTVDIWATGCILAEFINASPLFRAYKRIEHFICGVVPRTEIPFVLVQSLSNIGFCMRYLQLLRNVILCDEMGESSGFKGSSDLEQITKIFSVLGAPSEDTWPSWNDMPDAGKLIFDNNAPIKGLSAIVHTSNAVLLDLVEHQITLESSWRWSAAQLLRHPFLAEHIRENSSLLQYRPRVMRSSSIPRRLPRFRIGPHV